MQITLSSLIASGIRIVPYFTKEQAIQNTSILLDHIMVLALAVNSEESSRTQGRATWFIGIRLDKLKMLANLLPRCVGNIIILANQESATPPRVVSASVEDARTDDACRISDHLRLAGAADIPEVGNQHTAAPP